MSVRAVHGDCLDVLPTLGPVDAVVTDPPYHLVNMAGRAARPFKAKDGLQKNGAMARLAAGFMGQKWDGGDFAFRPETWATIGTALKPGGYLLAFGGTRTWHRLACAIEDAGFVIQDTIAWVYGSGFPKNKTLLKPAFEPIVMAYKPGGTRELQISECRIGTDQRTNPPCALKQASVALGGGWNADAQAKDCVGRWPANLCHDGSEEVLGLFPQAGGGFGKRGGNGHFGSYKTGTMQTVGFGNSGSAARFFFSAKADAEDRWGSRHPTVKPVALMKWLVQLVTPPNGIVLDPFAGSGTTGVAALATGRNAFLIEREPTWFADIQERIAFYEGEGRHSLQAKARRIAIPRGAIPLFEAAT